MLCYSLFINIFLLSAGSFWAFEVLILIDQYFKYIDKI